MPSAAELREPHRVARYLEALAATFHKFYDVCRVLPRGDEEPGRPCTAPGCSWSTQPGPWSRNGLDLLGVTAPDRM